MIAKLVAKYFECHPLGVGEGWREGKDVSQILWIYRSLFAGEWGEEEVQGIMNRENNMESWKGPDYGQHEVKDCIYLTNH